MRQLGRAIHYIGISASHEVGMKLYPWLLGFLFSVFAISCVPPPNLSSLLGTHPIRMNDLGEAPTTGVPWMFVRADELRSNVGNPQELFSPY